jgi:GAF domain-containing protein
VARPSPEGGQRALDEQGVFPGEHHLFTELRRRSNDTRKALQGCVGLSISLARAEALTFTFVRTDALPGVLDALQYLDDGPCETTIRTGEEIGIDDVLEEDRWLLFTRVSAATGIRSTLSLPLYRGPVVVGSVNIYGDVERAFSGMEADLAATFCAQVQAVIGNADLSTNPIRIASPTTTPSEEEALIDQALAVLVDKHGVPAESARQRLADAAGRARTSKTEVATGIVMSM